MYVLVVLGTVFGTSLAYDEGLTLEECRAGQVFLAGKVNGQPTCCLDRRTLGVTPGEACPPDILRFPYSEGDERFFGEMAKRGLKRGRPAEP